MLHKKHYWALAWTLAVVVAILPGKVSAASAYDDTVNPISSLQISSIEQPNDNINVTSTYLDYIMGRLPTYTNACDASCRSYIHDAIDSGYWYISQSDFGGPKTVHTFFTTDTTNVCLDFDTYSDQNVIASFSYSCAAPDSILYMSIVNHPNGVIVFNSGGALAQVRLSTGENYYRPFLSTVPIVYPSGYEGQLVPDTPPTVKYVAMGDSYSSGEGNIPYELESDTGTNTCHRSMQAYPRQVQGALDLGLTAFVACSGAVSDYIVNSYNTENIEPAQAVYMSEETELVTITIGGNDIGFADTLKTCTVPTQIDEEDECLGAIADSHAIATSTTFGNQLLDTFEGIRDLGGANTQIIVLGYPNLFPEYENITETCTWGNGLFGTSGRSVSSSEVWAARLLHDKLNDAISNAVEDLDDSNVHYADPSEEFEGHELCTASPWLNGVQVHVSTAEIASDSFHPNEYGQAAYAAVVEDEIGEFN